MTEPTYVQLMQRAESAVSRKEAKKLINLATETMTKSSDTSRCYYNIDQLNDFLILQEQKLASAQAHVRTAEVMIELINQKKKFLQNENTITTCSWIYEKDNRNSCFTLGVRSTASNGRQDGPSS